MSADDMLPLVSDIVERDPYNLGNLDLEGFLSPEDLGWMNPGINYSSDPVIFVTDTKTPEQVKQIYEVAKTRTVYVYFVDYNSVKQMSWIKFLRYLNTEFNWFRHSTYYDNGFPKEKSDMIFNLSRSTERLYFNPRESPTTPIGIIEMTLSESHCLELAKHSDAFKWESQFLRIASEYKITANFTNNIWMQNIIKSSNGINIAFVSSCIIKGPLTKLDKSNLADWLRCLCFESYYLYHFKTYLNFMETIQRLILLSIYLDILDSDSTIDTLRKQVSMDNLFEVINEGSVIQTKLWNFAQTIFQSHPDYLLLVKLQRLIALNRLMIFAIDWEPISMIVSKWQMRAEELKSRMQKYTNSSWSISFYGELKMPDSTIYGDLAICDFIVLEQILNFRHTDKIFRPEWLTKALATLKLPATIHHIIERYINIYNTYLWMKQNQPDFYRWIYYILNVIKIPLGKCSWRMKSLTPYIRKKNSVKIDPTLLPCKNNIPHTVVRDDEGNANTNLLIPIEGKPIGVAGAPRFVSSLSDNELFAIAALCTSNFCSSIMCCYGKESSSKLDLLKFAGIPPAKPLPIERVHFIGTCFYAVFPSVAEIVADIDHNPPTQTITVKANELSPQTVRSKLHDFVKRQDYVPSLNQFIVYLWNWQVTQFDTSILPSNIIELASQAINEAEL